MPDNPIATLVESRRETRMSAVPDIYRTNHERLACELAMKLEPADEVFARYGYTPEQAVILMESTAFSGLLDRVMREVASQGLSFKAKVSSLAEELLPEVYDMATDPHISAAVRTDNIQWAARMAGYEPKKDDTGQKGGGGLVLNITFAGQEQSRITREPVTIEQEA